MSNKIIEGNQDFNSFTFGRCVMRLRLAAVKVVCRLLLPRDVWVGKRFGAYTQRPAICLGKLDNRGVLQGVLDRDIGA